MRVGAVQLNCIILSMKCEYGIGYYLSLVLSCAACHSQSISLHTFVIRVRVFLEFNCTTTINKHHDSSFPYRWTGAWAQARTEEVTPVTRRPGCVVYCTKSGHILILSYLEGWNSGTLRFSLPSLSKLILLHTINVELYVD